MTALTRGPLPARTYWRRRLLLILVALGLVVGTARLLGLGSDVSSEQPPRASQVAAQPSSDTEEPSLAAPDTPSETRERQPQRGQKKAKQDRGPVLAEPEGVCSDRDIAVTPTVRNAVGGAPVTFTLELRTITTPACTWQVSSTTLTMRITSGDDDIWTSQQCPKAIPKQDVVVRDNVSTEVEVTWSARRSDEDCSPTMTDWALPGWYYVDAAALAGEPSDLHFELEKPESEIKKRQRDDAGQEQGQRRGRG